MNSGNDDWFIGTSAATAAIYRYNVTTNNQYSNCTRFQQKTIIFFFIVSWIDQKRKTEVAAILSISLRIFFCFFRKLKLCSLLGNGHQFGYKRHRTRDTKSTIPHELFELVRGPANCLLLTGTRTRTDRVMMGGKRERRTRKEWHVDRNDNARFTYTWTFRSLTRLLTQEANRIECKNKRNTRKINIPNTSNSCAWACVCSAPNWFRVCILVSQIIMNHKLNLWAVKQYTDEQQCKVVPCNCTWTTRSHDQNKKSKITTRKKKRTHTHYIKQYNKWTKKKKKQKCVRYTNIGTRSSNQSAIELMLPKREFLTHLALSWKIMTRIQKIIRPFRSQDSKRTNEMHDAFEEKWNEINPMK